MVVGVTVVVGRYPLFAPTRVMRRVGLVVKYSTYVLYNWATE